MSYILPNQTYLLDHSNYNVDDEVYPSLFDESREDPNQHQMIINPMQTITEDQISPNN